MHENEPSAEQPAPTGQAPTSGLLDDLTRLARAVRDLFGAQLHLLAAELGLARSAVSWLLAAALAATIAGVGLGLTLLGLIGLLLAKWLGSWILAFVVLAVLEVVWLLGAIVLFRRCMHWMSLPGTRQEWRAIMQDTLHRAEHDIHTDEGEV
ncbi:ABC transporter ATP-binding protein [Dyella monticola]|uniref:ABC transporter ATP-binding protein n=1 Tax=Dyella monticola TaxID=1927958 RepID=A0A370X077_9GAMM|nr:ABC transporter ATP-binding protein [Dyella monticola]